MAMRGREGRAASVGVSAVQKEEFDTLYTSFGHDSQHVERQARRYRDLFVRVGLWKERKGQS
jgi:hypothetical protein